MVELWMEMRAQEHRRNQLQKTAEIHRLQKIVQAARPKVWRHFLATVSGVLVSSGLWRPTRYQPDSAESVL
jgi:hypothetical protein